MVDKDKMRLIHELRQQGHGWEDIHSEVGSNDVDRKAYYGYLMGLEDSSDEDLVKHAKTLQAIRKSRKVLGIERSINNIQIKSIVTKEIFDDQIKEAILKERRELKPLRSRKVKHTEVNEFHLFTISDYHYDGDIKRLQRDFGLIEDKIITEILKYDLYHIHLAELGDLIDGATLRVSQLRKIQAGMVSQTIEVSRMYMKLIENLLEHVDITFIILESSNHTQLRNLGTKQNELPDEDMMRIFVEFMKTAFKTQKGLVIISGEDLILDILGYKFYFGHGHLIRGKSGYLEKLQSDRNTIIDYGFFGHFHHTRQIDLHSTGKYDKKVFYVPSADRGDRSGFEKDHNLSSMPAIGFYVFDDVDGHTISKKLLLK
jgi:hypothetical protein